MSKVAFPAWLEQLRTSEGSRSNIVWLADEEIARSKFDRDKDSHLRMYDDVYFYTEEDLRGDAAARVGRCVKVGVGADGGSLVAHARSFKTIFPRPAELWFDPSAPETLFCALNDSCPPHLWFPIGNTIDSILSSTAIYFTGRQADPAETPGQYAGRVRGQSKGREVPDGWITSRFLVGMVDEMRSVENRFIVRSGFCRSFDAIATFDEDDRIVRETVFHTLHSFSRVRLEFHSWLQYDDGEGGTISPIVAEVTYPAAAHAELIRDWNRSADMDVPENLPVDVLAALFGYPIKGLARMYRVLGECTVPGDITYNMGLLVATEGHDPTLVACLRKYATHPAPRVRDRVGRYAHRIGHPELTREILAVEPDENVRQALRGLLGLAG